VGMGGSGVVFQGTQTGNSEIKTLDEAEANILAACWGNGSAGEDSSEHTMRRLWLPKEDFHAVLWFFPGGWSRPYLTHRWLGPDRVELSYFNAREQHNLKVRLAPRWVLCL